MPNPTLLRTCIMLAKFVAALSGIALAVIVVIISILIALAKA
jgi:hypothetical protein